MLDLSSPNRVLNITLPNGEADKIRVVEITLGTRDKLIQLQAESDRLRKLQLNPQQGKKNQKEIEAASERLQAILKEMLSTIAPDYDFSKIPISKIDVVLGAMMELSVKDLKTTVEKKTSRGRRGRKARSSLAATG